MIFKNSYKAVRLELNSLRARKFSLILLIFSPILINTIFYMIARTPVDWGAYRNIGIISYDLYAPAIFPLIILFISVQLTVLRIVGERAPFGTLDRDLLALSKTSIFLSKLIANFFIVILQVSVMYVGISLFFPPRNYGSNFVVIGLLLLVGLFGLILGLGISVFSKSKEQAIELVPVSLLILLIFSGITVSLESMSPFMRIIASNTPLALIFDSLRDIMLNGVGIEDIINNVYKLIVWISVVALASWIKFIGEIRR